MEIIKKTILQAVTTGTTSTGGTIIIPDLSVVYYFKIGIKQANHDLGFFDATETTNNPYLYPYGDATPIGILNL